MIALIATLAQAQWTGIRIQEGDDDLVPVGVAIRQWGPTKDVFFAIESRVPVLNGDHTAAVHHWSCSNASCTGATPVGQAHPIGDAVRLGQYWFPSMAVQRLDVLNLPRKLHIVARDRIRVNCVGTEAYAAKNNPLDDNIRFLDLREFTWDTQVGTLQITPASQLRLGDMDEVCEDAGTSWTKVFPGTGHVYTSYSWNETPYAHPAGVVPPDVEVADRPDNGGFWSNDVVPRWYWHAGDPTVHANPSFDFYDAEARAVAYDTTHGARVQFVDDATPWAHDVLFPGISDSTGQTIDADPSIAYHAAAGRYHLVGAPSGKEQVLYTTCQEAPGVDCLETAHWTVPTQIASGVRASVEFDGNRVFVIYEGAAAVTLLTKCVTDAAWTTQTPRVPPSGYLQSLYSGRPSMVVNKLDNVLHVAFTERVDNQPLINPDQGDAWWLRRTYSDCP
jgi:hypothetical protein